MRRDPCDLDAASTSQCIFKNCTQSCPLPSLWSRLQVMVAQDIPHRHLIDRMTEFTKAPWMRR